MEQRNKIIITTNTDKVEVVVVVVVLIKTPEVQGLQDKAQTETVQVVTAVGTVEERQELREEMD